MSVLQYKTKMVRSMVCLLNEHDRMTESSTYSLLHQSHLHSQDPSHRPTTDECTDPNRDT